MRVEQGVRQFRVTEDKGRKVVDTPVDAKDALSALLADRMNDALGLHPGAVDSAGEQVFHVDSKWFGQGLPADHAHTGCFDHRRELARAAESIEFRQVAGV